MLVTDEHTVVDRKPLAPSPYTNLGSRRSLGTSCATSSTPGTASPPCGDIIYRGDQSPPARSEPHLHLPGKEAGLAHIDGSSLAFYGPQIRHATSGNCPPAPPRRPHAAFQHQSERQAGQVPLVQHQHRSLRSEALRGAGRLGRCWIRLRRRLGWRLALWLWAARRPHGRGAATTTGAGAAGGG